MKGRAAVPVECRVRAGVAVALPIVFPEVVYPGHSLFGLEHISVVLSPHPFMLAVAKGSLENPGSFSGGRPSLLHWFRPWHMLPFSSLGNAFLFLAAFISLL